MKIEQKITDYDDLEPDDIYLYLCVDRDSGSRSLRSGGLLCEMGEDDLDELYIYDLNDQPVVPDSPPEPQNEEWWICNVCINGDVPGAHMILESHGDGKWGTSGPDTKWDITPLYKVKIK